MIPTYLIVGNFLSLCCAICIAISVVKKDKTNLIWWQIWDSVFGLLASLVLRSYSSASTSILCITRNILACKYGLTKFMTLLLIVIGVSIGLYVNNRGIFGLFPIAAFTGYTISMYWAKNDQQMRYSLIVNLSLWLIHDFYIQAYPSALMDVTLCVWTFYQAMRRVKRKRHMKKNTKSSYFTGE
ncbi:MAG: YgjV family protein [Alphaproteobacteria bacterium]|nr:YgjV family protein [Alphaproteobacteria bacterium]